MNIQKNPHYETLTNIAINTITLTLLKSETASRIFLIEEKENHTENYDSSILTLSSVNHCGREILYIIREALKFETVLSEDDAKKTLWQAIYFECATILYG